MNKWNEMKKELNIAKQTKSTDVEHWIQKYNNNIEDIWRHHLANTVTLTATINLIYVY